MWLATVLDPRWKNFTFLQSSFYQQHVESHACLTRMAAFDAKLLSYIHLHDAYLAHLTSHPKAAVCDLEDDMVSGGKTDFFDLMVNHQQPTSAVNSDSEFVTYENEKEIGRNENPLEWWRMHRSRYPRISSMAHKYVCIAATSSPCERMFPASGHLT